MANQMQTLILIAFFATGGLTLLILSCALPQFKGNWLPMLSLIFYVFAPVPLYLVSRASDGFGAPNRVATDLAYFFTAVICTSGLALPLVLYHDYSINGEPSHGIEASACALCISGTVLVYASILAYSLIFHGNSGYYSLN